VPTHECTASASIDAESVIPAASDLTSASSTPAPIAM